MAERKLYVIRHGPKDESGQISAEGRRVIEKAKSQGRLPSFQRIFSSNSIRARETARLLADKEPETDDRLGYFTTSTQEESDKLNEIARQEGISFLQAALRYGSEATKLGIKQKAQELVQFVDEVLQQMNDGEVALAVSHDMTIEPAVHELERVRVLAFLGGYVFDDQGNVVEFSLTD